LQIINNIAFLIISAVIAAYHRLLPLPEHPTIMKVDYILDVLYFLFLQDWHKLVTQELRNNLASKLIYAIFPSPGATATQDPRLHDLITYARNVEKEMFEVANDREEYYHLLAEKVYKIQKELQERKVARMEITAPLVNDGENTQRNDSIKKCIQSLVHACQCPDANCQ
jgi:hypothetical protein